MYAEEMPALVVSSRHLVTENNFLHTNTSCPCIIHFFLVPKPHLPCQKLSLFSQNELQLPWRNKQQTNAPRHGNWWMHNRLPSRTHQWNACRVIISKPDHHLCDTARVSAGRLMQESQHSSLAPVRKPRKRYINRIRLFIKATTWQVQSLALPTQTRDAQYHILTVQPAFPFH